MTRTTKTTTLSYVFYVLPWVLVVVGALLFVIGLSWRNLSSSDTVNPFFVIGGVLFVMLAGVLSCCADRTPLRDDDRDGSPSPQPAPAPAPPPMDSAISEKREAQIPFVSI